MFKAIEARAGNVERHEETADMTPWKVVFLIFTNDSGIVANGFGSGNLYFFNAVVSSCDIRFYTFYCIVLLLDIFVPINL